MKKSMYREIHFEEFMTKEEIEESVNTDSEIVTETDEKNVKNTPKSGKKNVKTKKNEEV